MKKSKNPVVIALSMILFACGGDGAADTSGGPVVVLPPPPPPPAPPPPPPPTSLTVTADPANLSVTRDMKVLPLLIAGRVRESALSSAYPAGAKSYTHQWPAVYFEAAFNGDNFVIKFDDIYNEYRLFIDNLAVTTLAQPGKTEYKITGLSTGMHRIRLEKVTESISELGAFSGFYIPAAAQSMPVPARPRQIEFIGDSNMAGYGLRSATRQCTQDQVRLLSDAQASYPAKTARHFGADYQVNAISGRGMARNYDGIVPDLTLPLVYPFNLLDKTGSYSDPLWQPQIIVIGLGGNDFSTPVKPGEQWATPRDLIADYFDSYERFLRTLYARNPGASVIILWPDTPSLTDPADRAIFDSRRVSLTATAQTIGFRNILFTAIPEQSLGLEATACDFHANANDHDKMTQWLITQLDANTGFWAGK